MILKLSTYQAKQLFPPSADPAKQLSPPLTDLALSAQTAEKVKWVCDYKVVFTHKHTHTWSSCILDSDEVTLFSKAIFVSTNLSLSRVCEARVDVWTFSWVCTIMQYIICYTIPSYCMLHNIFAYIPSHPVVVILKLSTCQTKQLFPPSADPAKQLSPPLTDLALSAWTAEK